MTRRAQKKLYGFRSIMGLRRGFSKGTIAPGLLLLVLAIAVWNQVYIPLHLASAAHSMPGQGGEVGGHQHGDGQFHSHAGGTFHSHDDSDFWLDLGSSGAESGEASQSGEGQDGEDKGHHHHPHSALDHLVAFVVAVVPAEVVLPPLELLPHTVAIPHLIQERSADTVAPASRGPPSFLS